jgi:hypothetical protein
VPNSAPLSFIFKSPNGKKSHGCAEVPKHVGIRYFHGKLQLELTDEVGHAQNAVSALPNV